jgi:Domain of unknown function (DUF1707)
MPDEERGDQVQPAVELRASHEDRDRVAEILRVAAGDGRLTAEELDERLEAALTARTQRELAVLTVDLPAVGSAAVGVPAPTPKDLVRIDTHSGTARRDGPWVVPQAMDVKVTGGHVVLDFTNAVITAPVLKVHAEVKSGTMRLVTKPGIVVETDDVAIHSGNTKVRTPWGHDVPVTLRVEVSGSVGSGSLTAGPRHRNFWQWLLRRRPPYEAIAGR